MRKTRGFTLVELLVVVAIIALLVAILLPTLGRARELARQASCQSQLGGIGRGFAMYHADNNDLWPMLPDIDQTTAVYSTALQFGADVTFAALKDGAQQNLCMLVAGGAVGWKMFICPSSGNSEKTDRSDATKYGFGDGTKIHIDYGFQIPYTGTKAADGTYPNKCPLTNQMDPGVVVLGDKGPAEAKCKTDWSLNHSTDGDAVLYAGLSVKFSKDKTGTSPNVIRNTGGWGGNNIYLSDTYVNPNVNIGSTIAIPGFAQDTVLYSK